MTGRRKSLLLGRLTPDGFMAFISCSIAQRRHLAKTWPEAIRTAWFYGPTMRRVPAMTGQSSVVEQVAKVIRGHEWSNDRLGCNPEHGCTWDAVGIVQYPDEAWDLHARHVAESFATAGLLASDPTLAMEVAWHTGQRVRVTRAEITTMAGTLRVDDTSSGDLAPLALITDDGGWVRLHTDGTHYYQDRIEPEGDGRG